jgi:hypothetical protein
MTASAYLAQTLTNPCRGLFLQSRILGLTYAGLSHIVTSLAYCVSVTFPRPVIQRLSRVVELTIGNKCIELDSGAVHSLPGPASRQSLRDNLQSIQPQILSDSYYQRSA